MPQLDTVATVVQVPIGEHTVHVQDQQPDGKCPLMDVWRH